MIVLHDPELLFCWRFSERLDALAAVLMAKERASQIFTTLNTEDNQHWVLEVTTSVYRDDEQWEESSWLPVTVAIELNRTQGSFIDCGFAIYHGEGEKPICMEREQFSMRIEPGQERTTENNYQYITSAAQELALVVFQYLDRREFVWSRGSHRYLALT